LSTEFQEHVFADVWHVINKFKREAKKQTLRRGAFETTIEITTMMVGIKAESSAGIKNQFEGALSPETFKAL